MNRKTPMGKHRRKRRKLDLQTETLRVLDAGDLEQIAGGNQLARRNTRYCITTYEP